MEEQGKIMIERKEKIKNWFKDRQNLFLFLIISFALILRLYYFFITSNQALWWDEAEYMLKAKTIFQGTPITGLAPFREVFIPYIWSVLFLLGNGELLVRFSQAIISTLTVLLTYLVGKQLINKKVGIISALFMAVMPIQLFFTERVLTYLWTPFIYLLVVYLFIKGQENIKYYYLSAIILGFGLIAYFNTLFLVVTIFVFLLLTKGFKLFVDKKSWIYLLVFLLAISPFVIFYYSTMGVPHPRFSQFEIVSQGAVSGNYLQFTQWFGYIVQFPRILGDPQYFGFPMFLFFLISLISILDLILGIDLIKTSEEIKRKLFLWLLVIVPLGCLTLIEIVQNSTVFYDAFLMPTFPFLAITSAIGFMYCYNFIKPKYSNLAKLFTLIIIIFFIFANVSYSTGLINGKVTSYDTIRDAGFWIKQNSDISDIMMTSAFPEITYYSERNVITPPGEESNLSQIINEKHPKYFIISAYEAVTTPKWSFDFSQRNPTKFIPVAAFPQTSSPTTIVYYINQSAFA
jgi:4-amino-4-deoxy-L-arabinose transferase-like glycosyltransferase